MRKLICCNGAKPQHSKFESIMQCDGCMNLWHSGCWEELLKAKDYICCVGSSVTFTKFKNETELMRSSFRGQLGGKGGKLPPETHLYTQPPFPSELLPDPGLKLTTVLKTIAATVLFFVAAALIGNGLG